MLKLTHPAVQEAKQRYEQIRKGPKPKLKFEELYYKYTNPHLSFRAIAKELESNPSHIIQLFQTFFRPIIPPHVRSSKINMSPEDRRKREQRIQGLEEQDQVSPAALLLTAAKQRNFACKRIITPTYELMKWSVIINGHRCFTLHSTNPRQADTLHLRRYFRFTICKNTVMQAKFVILVTKSANRRDYYILKKDELINFSGSKKVFYIPDVTTPRLKNFQPSADQQLFEEAHNNWDLLRTAV